MSDYFLSASYFFDFKNSVLPSAFFSIFESYAHLHRVRARPRFLNILFLSCFRPPAIPSATEARETEKLLFDGQKLLFDGRKSHFLMVGFLEYRPPFYGFFAIQKPLFYGFKTTYY
ncbi:MAG: hypothetical protein LBU35_02700 [Holosporales bacterium]|jgi:hypothetical protein|nr:hypothetical protein [Holosporales bacterium]